MARGDRVNFRFYVARSGFFKRLPVIEHELPIEHHSDYVAEIRLMRAVLDQVIHDLGSSTQSVREAAEEWIDMSNGDFHLVCESADVDTRATYWAFRNTLSNLSRSKLPMKDILAEFGVTDEYHLILKIINKGIKDAKQYSVKT